MVLEPNDAVEGARAAFRDGRTRPIAFRKTQLQRLLSFVTENADRLTECFRADVGRAPAEAHVELCVATNHIKYVLRNVERWARPRRPPKRLVEALFGVEVRSEPFGVVLVLGSWNVPLMTLLPVAGAIAAGNAVVIKPSHNAPLFSEFLAATLPRYLDPQLYPVFVGNVERTTRLLEERFDYIYYTGSAAVGKIVHRAATRFLTPTTLELGGKSPVFVDGTVDMAMAARRIVWGKFFNAGQTCIAPDYVLCVRTLVPRFVEAAACAIRQFYGSEPKRSPDLSRIATRAHFQRLTSLLKGQSVAVGGGADEGANLIEPTIIVDVDPRSAVMQEEIFGPLLPVVAVEDVREAIAIINAGEKPLALYVFSNDGGVRELLLGATSSGAAAVNDTLLHLIVENLPFGGVGASGMGAYKGRQSFDTFSHRKGVLVSPTAAPWERLMGLRYPPATQQKRVLMEFVLAYRWFEGRGPAARTVGAFLAGFVFCLLVFGLYHLVQ